MLCESGPSSNTNNCHHTTNTTNKSSSTPHTSQTTPRTIQKLKAQRAFVMYSLFRETSIRLLTPLDLQFNEQNSPVKISPISPSYGTLLIMLFVRVRRVSLHMLTYLFCWLLWIKFWAGSEARPGSLSWPLLRG